MCLSSFCSAKRTRLLVNEWSFLLVNEWKKAAGPLTKEDFVEY